MYVSGSALRHIVTLSALRLVGVALLIVPWRPRILSPCIDFTTHRARSLRSSAMACCWRCRHCRRHCRAIAAESSPLDDHRANISHTGTLVPRRFSLYMPQWHTKLGRELYDGILRQCSGHGDTDVARLTAGIAPASGYEDKGEYAARRGAVCGFSRRRTALERH